MQPQGGGKVLSQTQPMVILQISIDTQRQKERGIKPTEVQDSAQKLQLSQKVTQPEPVSPSKGESAAAVPALQV